MAEQFNWSLAVPYKLEIERNGGNYCRRLCDTCRKLGNNTSDSVLVPK